MDRPPVPPPIDRLIEVYPAALSYKPDRDPPVYETAEGADRGGARRAEEIDDAKDPETDAPVEVMIAYRLTDEYAEGTRQTAAEKSKRARWN